MTINGIKITDESIQATRQHFINVARQCIDEAVSGKMRVNDLDRWVAKQNEQIERHRSGDTNFSLTFMQYALYVQTGQCVTMLA